jgi:hypothetical protein
MRDGRWGTIRLTADGTGVVAHAGTALLCQVADQLGLTRVLSRGLAGLKAA